MSGLRPTERERADGLEAMWLKEGRAVMFNRAGDDLTPQARVGKWLHEKARAYDSDFRETAARETDDLRSLANEVLALAESNHDHSRGCPSFDGDECDCWKASMDELTQAAAEVAP